MSPRALWRKGMIKAMLFTRNILQNFMSEAGLFKNNNTYNQDNELDFSSLLRNNLKLGLVQKIISH